MRASLTTQVVPSIGDQPCVNFYRLHPTLGKLIFRTIPHSKFMSTGFSGALAFYSSPAFNGLNKSWDTKNIWVTPTPALLCKCLKIFVLFKFQRTLYYFQEIFLLRKYIFHLLSIVYTSDSI